MQIILGDIIAVEGEGTIYSLQNNPDLVMKEVPNNLLTGVYNLLEIDITRRIRHPNIVEAVDVVFSYQPGESWISIVMPRALCDLDIYSRCFRPKTADENSPESTDKRTSSDSLLEKGKEDILNQPSQVKEAFFPIDSEEICNLLPDLPQIISEEILDYTAIPIFDGRCKDEELWEIFVDAICGLDILHQQNIVHADFKQSNILVYEQPDRKIGKLCDFGWSGILLFRPYLENLQRGTNTYHAPECEKSLRYDFASDIWAVGIAWKELFPDKYEHRDLLERMLSLNPKERPSTREILDILGRDNPGLQLLLDESISGDIAKIENSKLEEKKWEVFDSFQGENGDTSVDSFASPPFGESESVFGNPFGVHRQQSLLVERRETEPPSPALTPEILHLDSVSNVEDVQNNGSKISRVGEIENDAIHNLVISKSTIYKPEDYPDIFEYPEEKELFFSLYRRCSQTFSQRILENNTCSSNSRLGGKQIELHCSQECGAQIMRVCHNIARKILELEPILIDEFSEGIIEYEQQVIESLGGNFLGEIISNLHTNTQFLTSSKYISRR